MAGACSVCASAPAALGASSRGEVHAVFWEAQADERQLADDFFRCLTEGTSFSGPWSSEFAIPKVVYVGSVVLPGTLTGMMQLSTVARALVKAFDMGLLPPPVSGVANEYISFTPQTAVVDGICTGPTAGCGEHDWHNSYKGVPFDVASVPVGPCNCHAHWATESQKTTEVAEHETGEGLARLAGAGYEVGDACENPKYTITCCGTSYQAQALASSKGASSCEVIKSTGNTAACASDGGAGATSGADAGATSGTDAGGSSGRASSGGTGSGSSSSGEGTSSASSGGSSTGQGAPSGSSGTPSGSVTATSGSLSSAGGTGTSSSGSASSLDGGFFGEEEAGTVREAPGSTNAGCSCRAVGDRRGGERKIPGQAWASIGAFALALVRRRQEYRKRLRALGPYG
jgi:hypothetical protein